MEAGRIEMKRCRKRDLNKNYAFESITTAWSEIKTTFWRSESHLNGFPPAAAAPPRQIFSTLVWKWDFKTWKRNATGRFWIFTSNQMVEEVFQFGTKSQSTWSTCTKQTVCTWNSNSKRIWRRSTLDHKIFVPDWILPNVWHYCHHFQMNDGFW